MPRRGPALPGAIELIRSQPAWFRNLFWVDLWERFSFYGMGAIMFLYASSPSAAGGLGLSLSEATALYGAYIALVFVAALPGGWIADKLLGARGAIGAGAVLITAGHMALAVPLDGLFFVGLILIASGSGLVKPSIASLVSQSGRSHQDREAAISVFYMSIQISALIAPIVVGLLAERVNWHAGFGAAAAGMVIAMVLYRRGGHRFGSVGRRDPGQEMPARKRRTVLIGLALGLILTLGVTASADSSGRLSLQPILIAVGLCALVLPGVYLLGLTRQPAVNGPARTRLAAYATLMVASALFWGMYAQGHSVLTEFARSSMERHLGAWEVPASWFLAVHPAAILVLAPLAAATWVRSGAAFNAPRKIATGLGLMGSSWLVLAMGAMTTRNGQLASPLWLVIAYVLQAIGELMVAPAGLALATRIAPAGYQVRYGSIFWLFCAAGAAFGGIVGGQAANVPLYLYFAVAGAAALIVAAVTAAISGVLHRRLDAGLRTNEPPPETEPDRHHLTSTKEIS